MTEAGKGAKEVQDIFLENAAMFQKVCDRIQFEGVSRSEFAMLHMIHNKKDERGKLTLSELAAFLDVSSPAVSRMIKTLEDKKYIVKSPSEKDRRISYVSASGQAEVIEVSEMESNEEVWADWLMQENEYAVNDRAAMNAGGGRHLNFIKIVLRKK